MFIHIKSFTPIIQNLWGQKFHISQEGQEILYDLVTGQKPDLHVVIVKDEFSNKCVEKHVSSKELERLQNIQSKARNRALLVTVLLTAAIIFGGLYAL